MTTEKAVDILENIMQYPIVRPIGRNAKMIDMEELHEAVRMAIEALRKELKA